MGKYADEQATIATLGARADAEILEVAESLAESEGRRVALEGLNASLSATSAQQATTISQRDATIAAQVGLLNERAATIAARDTTIVELRRLLAESQANGAPIGYANLLSFVPTGGDWVDALAVASGAVWIPEGVHETDAWRTGEKIVMTVAKAVTKLDGPGPDKAMLRLRPSTSQWTATQVNAGATTPLSVLQQTGGQLEHMGGFTLDCTEQGHNYHGWSIYNPVKNGVVVENMVTLGTKGTGGAPPFETFQATIHGGANHRVRNCVFDGKINGIPAAAVNLTFQDTINSFAEDCTFIDGQASMFVTWQAFDSGTRRCKFYAPTDPLRRFASAIINAGERSAGDLHEDVEIYGGVYKKSEHFSHSNDYTPFRADGQEAETLAEVASWRHYTRVWDGVTRTTNNGKLTIINPVTWPDWWNKAATGKTEQITPATLFVGDDTRIIVSTWGTRKVRSDGLVYFKYGPSSLSQETTYTSPEIKTVVNGVTKQLGFNWLRYGVHRNGTKYPYQATNPA